MAENSSVRVRFAPSPTGYLHVGGARTALFNWLFARKTGGTLILRIEDTDFERSSEEMVTGILEGMSWLGLDWNEGPFYQSKRLDLYRATAEKFLASGDAYYCFCTKEKLEEARTAAHAAGRTPMYPETCRKLTAEEVAKRRANGEACALRFAVPESGTTVVEDAVFGKVEFANTEIEDFVILRSDGIPTYNLCVVADDIDMRLTHVIRGADHLSNTPKQILQYQALGAAQPIFAHVPLILGADKTRLSKRHGATSVISYKQEGIVPEAFRNFLALLGWTPADSSKEVMSDAELIAAFGLENISHSNAVFDRAKLDWFNTEYIRSYSAAKLLPYIREEWDAASFKPESNDEKSIHSAIDLLKSRARNLKDFATTFRGYFSDDYQTEPAAIDKFLKDPAVRDLLAELGERYAKSEEFTEVSTEAVLRALADEKTMKAGALINGARVALTGQAVAPSLFAVMALLGKDKTVRRLRNAPKLQS
ncbi:MAG TPA: glutamate--tRNA ligase [Terriglobales bacterium]|nr:glutamate--tRNA ligase [Terriglobales bacterium]